MNRPPRRHQWPDKPVGPSLLLGVPSDAATFYCADCGLASDPQDASWAKLFVLDEVLGCQVRVIRLLLTPGRQPDMTSRLGAMGYGTSAAADLIGGARELGVLEGHPYAPQPGQARCDDCYLRRAEQARARRNRVIAV